MSDEAKADEIKIDVETALARMIAGASEKDQESFQKWVAIAKSEMENAKQKREHVLQLRQTVEARQATWERNAEGEVFTVDVSPHLDVAELIAWCQATCYGAFYYQDPAIHGKGAEEPSHGYGVGENGRAFLTIRMAVCLRHYFQFEKAADAALFKLFHYTAASISDVLVK